MAGLDRQQLEDLAFLARLSFEGDELDAFNGQFNRILDYVSQLQELDLDGVEPAAHILQLVNVMREDTAEPSGVRDDVLENAPDRDGPFFRTPQFVGE